MKKTILLAAGLLALNASAADLFAKPQETCQLLAAQGLPTAGWKARAGNEWGCSSTLASFGAPAASGLPSNIAFYVSGTSGSRAGDIRVKVNINNPATAKLAMAKLREATEILFRTAGEPVPENMLKALDRGTMAFAQTSFGTAELMQESGNIASFKLMLTSNAVHQQQQLQVAAARGDFEKCTDVTAKAAGYGADLLTGDGRPTNEGGMKSFMYKGPGRDLFFCEVYPDGRYLVKGARGGQFPFRPLASGKL